LSLIERVAECLPRPFFTSVVHLAGSYQKPLDTYLIAPLRKLRWNISVADPTLLGLSVNGFPRIDLTIATVMLKSSLPGARIIKILEESLMERQTTVRAVKTLVEITTDEPLDSWFSGLLGLVYCIC
jgi:hypothetical protein